MHICMPASEHDHPTATQALTFPLAGHHHLVLFADCIREGDLGSGTRCLCITSPAASFHVCRNVYACRNVYGNVSAPSETKTFPGNRVLRTVKVARTRLRTPGR